MKEENFLLDTFGKENHFKVPTGYFDSFADKLMEQLPEPEARVIKMRAPSLWRQLPIRKIAAVIAVAAFLGSGSFFLVRQHVKSATMPVTIVADEHSELKVSGDESFDQMADYIMMDNQEIYASLLSGN